MPSLICSSRYTLDSQILRRTAKNLGWETLRLDGTTIPDWFEPPDDQIALFYIAPHSFDIARQLGRQLVGCPADWTCCLPEEFLLRDLRQVRPGEARGISGCQFVKHSVSKAFPAAVYRSDSLSEAISNLPSKTLVHVGEPVTWAHEFRCFVADRSVMTISPYVYHGQVVPDYDSFPDVAVQDLEHVHSFVQRVLSHPEVSAPPAFVLDVGLIQDRGWAVVECNECWASGVYACDPAGVLETLLSGCVAMKEMDSQWDFAQHYAEACAAPTSEWLSKPEQQNHGET